MLKLCLWPVSAIVRRHYGVKRNLNTAEQRIQRWIRLICAVNLFLLVAYTYFVIDAFESLSILSTKNDSIIRVFQAIAVIAALGTLVPIYNCYRTWLNHDRGVWTKLHETAIALACLGFIWIILQGNLLDFTLRY